MASTVRILRLFLRESHASRSNDERSRRNLARLISKADAFGNEKMITRSQFYQLALEANEGQANVRDDVLPVPTLDERVSLYLRAVYGNREFTDQERSNARNALLDSMAAEITAQVQPEVTNPRPLHSYDAATQHQENVRRKETIRAVPIARRPSTLALTATLRLVLIVTGGTLGYRWTHPHVGEDVSEPSQQHRVPSPTTSPRSLSTRPTPSEQPVVQIASQRSEADVLAVFRRLQQEEPALFAQAALKLIDRRSPLTASRYTAERRSEAFGLTGQLGPFASKEDAAAACRALEAADIQCIGRPEGR